MNMTVSGQSIEQQIEHVASPLAQAIAVDIVEVCCSGKGAGSRIRITIDKPGGVGIQDCEEFHHSLSRALDVLDPIPHSYRLEVSSPGLDRPLKHRKDYQRALTKLISVQIEGSDKNKSSFCGHLQNVSDEGICILPVSTKGKKKPLMNIAWEMIVKGKLEVEF